LLVSTIITATATFFHVYQLSKSIKMTPHPLPVHQFSIFAPAAFFLAPKVKSKLAVDLGHLQEELVGIAPSIATGEFAAAFQR
jgi:hypothetical protein